MKTVHGDLLALAEDGHFDVIAHGCNCFCNMGKGIALSIRRQYPAAFDADRATPKGDRAKLGTCSSARIVGRTQPFVLVNAYTQYHGSGPRPLVDLEAVRSCMGWIRDQFSGQRIGLPRIGAGLAGGDWPTLAAIIDEVLVGEDVSLVEYVGPPSS